VTIVFCIDVAYILVFFVRLFFVDALCPFDIMVHVSVLLCFMSVSHNEPLMYLRLEIAVYTPEDD
jgi:hypothetical protein